MKSNTVFQVDSREKKNSHILAAFDAAGIKYFVSKVPYGDYISLDSGRYTVERKASILELCANLGKEHKRFKEELKNAARYGIHITILIEDESRKDIEDLKSWINPNTSKNVHALTGERLYKILKTLQSYYGFDVVFCKPEEAGTFIINLLKKAA